MKGKIFLCPQSGRVMVDPGDGSLPCALHDYARAHCHATKAARTDPAPSPPTPHHDTEAASAAASCSRTF